MDTVKIPLICEAWPVILDILNKFNRERMDDLLRDDDFLAACKEGGYNGDKRLLNNSLFTLAFEIDALLKQLAPIEEESQVALELLPAQWEMIQIVLDTEYEEISQCGEDCLNCPFSGDCSEFSGSGAVVAVDLPSVQGAEKNDEVAVEDKLDFLAYILQELEICLWGMPAEFEGN